MTNIVYHLVGCQYLDSNLWGLNPTYLGPELNLSNILSFLKDGGFSSAAARSLGIHLLLPMATIKTLKKNNVDDADGLLMDIIDSWLNQTEPSWGKLARALDKCDYQRIARECEFVYSYFSGGILVVDLMRLFIICSGPFSKVEALPPSSRLQKISVIFYRKLTL